MRILQFYAGALLDAVSFCILRMFIIITSMIILAVVIVLSPLLILAPMKTRDIFKRAYLDYKEAK